MNATSRTEADALAPWLGRGQTVAFVGSSGVGKSTLVNTLLASAVQETSGIREHDAKGRHTTTSRLMFALPSGAWVIDTPGMRELSSWAMEDAGERSVRRYRSPHTRLPLPRLPASQRCGLRAASRRCSRAARWTTARQRSEAAARSGACGAVRAGAARRRKALGTHGPRYLEARSGNFPRMRPTASFASSSSISWPCSPTSTEPLQICELLANVDHVEREFARVLVALADRNAHPMPPPTPPEPPPAPTPTGGFCFVRSCTESTYVMRQSGFSAACW